METEPELRQGLYSANLDGISHPLDRLGRLRQWFAYWLQDVKPVDQVPARADMTGL